MLTCEEVTRRTSELIDGNLPFGERVGIWLHLGLCQHCRRFYRHLRRLVASLAGRAAKLEPVSDEFVERVLAGIKLEDRGSSS